MSIGNVLEELKSRYRNALEQVAFACEELRNADIEKWSDQLSISRSTLYDELAMQLALGFHRQEFSFQFCDSIANDIHRIITLHDEAWPALFWDVFLAFDAGEYAHRGDDRAEDPVEKYTRPLITEAISKYRIESKTGGRGYE